MINEFLPPEHVLFEGHPALIGSFPRLCIVFITLGLGILYFWLECRTRRYRITSQRILIEEGFFSQKVHTIELVLVEDMEIEKPFGQRLLGTGNLLLLTRDVSNPRVHLHRLPINVRDLYEKLRIAIQEERHRQHLYREQDDWH